MSAIIAANYLRRGARKRVRKVANQVARRAAVVAATSLVKHRKRRHRNRRKHKTTHIDKGTPHSVGARTQTHVRSLLRTDYNTPKHTNNFDKNNYSGNLKQMWLDPFACNGVTRIADDSIQPTAVMTLTHRNVAAASGTGNITYYITPNPNYGVFCTSGSTVGSRYQLIPIGWSEQAGLWPNGLNNNGNIDRYRCVSMGARLTCIDTTATSKGMMVGGCVAADEITAPVWDSATSNWVVNSMAGNYSTNLKFQTAPASSSLYVKWIPSTAVDYEFKNPLVANTDYTNFTSTPYKSELVLGVVSTSPGQAYMIEVVSHWEWIPISSVSLMVPVTTAQGKTEQTEKVKDWFRSHTDSRCITHPKGTTSTSSGVSSSSSSSSSSQGVLSPWGGIDYITKLPSGDDSSKTYPAALSTARVVPPEEMTKIIEQLQFNNKILQQANKDLAEKLTVREKRTESNTTSSGCSGECIGCDFSDCQYWDHEGTVYVQSLVETIKRFIKKGDRKTAETIAETTREQLKTCHDDSTHKFLDGLITSSLV